MSKKSYGMDRIRDQLARGVTLHKWDLHYVPWAKTPLSTRAVNCLVQAGYTLPDEVEPDRPFAKFTEPHFYDNGEPRRITQLGPKTIAEIQRWIERDRQEFPGWVWPELFW